MTSHQRANVPMAGDIETAAAAIRVQRLGKRYEMYDRPHQRLLQTIFRGRKQYFREFWALRDVNFQIARGETVGIIGRNGSGKSTLLQLITGTLAPTEGSIDVNGRVAALLELGSGFNPEFTGRENVFLNGAILGMTRRDMLKALPDIEAFASIGDFIDQPVKLYSSGMLIRLAFAVAIHVTPDVLLVDETLAVGDVAFQSKCLDRIRRMQEVGTAILLVSHSANTIIEFCSRAIYLDRGRVVLAGPCREVLEQYGNDLVSQEGGTALVQSSDPKLSSSPGPIKDRATHLTIDLPSTEIVSVDVLDAAGISTACVAHGDEIAIVITAKFHRPNPNPCLGLEIKSTDDIVLWSATTQYLGLHPAETHADRQRRYTWRLRANFGGSRYVLAVGIGEIKGGEYRRHSRLHYAGHFDVLSEARRGNGFLEPNITFAEGEAVNTGSAGSA